MDKQWYFLCGDRDEMTIVYAYEHELDDIGALLMPTGYAVFGIYDAMEGARLAESRSEHPPYLPENKKYLH